MCTCKSNCLCLQPFACLWVVQCVCVFVVCVYLHVCTNCVCVCVMSVFVYVCMCV